MMDQRRVDLAAVHRLLSRDGLNEGIDNHVSLGLGDGTFLLTPDALHWDMLNASDLLQIDAEGSVAEGVGPADEITLALHRAIQQASGGACVIHTHMPYTLAIACTVDGVIEPISQNALRFVGRIAYEDEYGGLGFEEEARRIAQSLRGQSILISRNHGVFIAAPTCADAYELTYYLERAAMVQVLATSLRKPLQHVPATVAERTALDFAGPGNRAKQFFAASKRLLDLQSPSYRT